MQQAAGADLQIRSVPPEIVVDQRLWGSQTQLTLNESTSVAFLNVQPGQALSEQSHKRRSELWIVLSGAMDVELDGEIIRLSGFGARIFIPVGAHHRAYGLEEECTYLEIAYGEYDSNDIVRHKDMYNRAG